MHEAHTPPRFRRAMRPSVGMRPPCVACGHVKRCSAYLPTAMLPSMHLAESFESDRPIRHQRSLHTHRNRHLRRKASYMARGSTHCPSLTTSNRARSSPEFLDIGRPRRVRCFLRHAFRYIFPPHGGLSRAPKSLR